MESSENNKVDEALQSFYEDNGTSFIDKVSTLRQAIMWNSIETMKTIRKHGLKSPISEDEEYKQVEVLKQYKIFERLFATEIKANKLKGIPEDQIGKEWLQKIKDSDDGLGKIVVDQKKSNE